MKLTIATIAASLAIATSAPAMISTTSPLSARDIADGVPLNAAFGQLVASDQLNRDKRDIADNDGVTLNQYKFAAGGSREDDGTGRFAR